MKVINQSFEILPENTNKIFQIESRGRICYKSEDKINELSSIPFVKNIISRKHNSVLEMAIIQVKTINLERIWYLTPKYFCITDNIITATVRGWREFFINNIKEFSSVILEFKEKFPILFDDIIVDNNLPKTRIHFIDTCPNDDLYHTWVAVKFITDRTMSHELVRHRPLSVLQESQRYVNYSNEIVFIKPTPYFEDDEISFNKWTSMMSTCENLYKELYELKNTPQACRKILPNSCKTELIIYTNLREWRHILYLRTSSGADPMMRSLMIPLYYRMKELYPISFEKLLPVIGD